MTVVLIGSQPVPPYSILGTRPTNGSVEGVRHVGIAPRGAEATPPPLAEVEIPLLHCAPPLYLDELRGARLFRDGDIAGFIDLSTTEINDLKRTLLDLESSVAKLPERSGSILQLRDYTIVPSVGREMDPETGVERLRFSCAGFVAHCFAEAGRMLVDESDLPLVTEPTLEGVWGAADVRMARLVSARWSLGLHGNGPDAEVSWSTKMDVFLSFSKTDARPAALLSKILRRALGARSVFKADHLDATGIEPGEDWRTRIRAVIGKCRCLVALATPRFISERWFWIEAGAVWARDPGDVYTIAPVGLDAGATSPFDHKQIVYADPAQVERLLSLLYKKIRRHPLAVSKIVRQDIQT